MDEKQPLNVLREQAELELKKELGEQDKKKSPIFQQKAIRTFESDLAEALAKGNSSVATMITAENKRKDEQQREIERVAKAQSDQQAQKKAESAAKSDPKIQMGNLIGNTEGYGNDPMNNPHNQEQLLNQKPDPILATETKSKSINVLDTTIPEKQEARKIEFKDLNAHKPSETFLANPPVSPPTPLAEAPVMPPASTLEPIIPPAPVSPPPPKKMVFEKPKVQRIELPPEKEPTKSEIYAESNHTLKKVSLVILSLILIGSGISGGYYLYMKSPVAPDKPAEPVIKVASLIPVDIQRKLIIPENNKAGIVGAISEGFSSQGADIEKITELIPVRNIGSTTVRLTASQFIEASEFSLTDSLKRAITDKWMLGVYTEDNSTNAPFIVLTTDFFQNAYAGMLKWELQMPDELEPILNYSAKAQENYSNNSTTAPAFFNIRGTFVDKTIRNRDVREFVMSNGEPLLLYTFIDPNTVVITTSEAVIPAILDRIEKQTYVR